MAREIKAIQSACGHVLVRDEDDARVWTCSAAGCRHRVVTPAPDQPELAAEMDVEGCPAVLRTLFQFVSESAAA